MGDGKLLGGKIRCRETGWTDLAAFLPKTAQKPQMSPGVLNSSYKGGGTPDQLSGRKGLGSQGEPC